MSKTDDGELKRRVIRQLLGQRMRGERSSRTPRSMTKAMEGSKRG